jgi:hypothetical protein
MGQLHTKRCPSCQETKSLSEYYRDKRRKHGVQAFCKVCHTAKTKRWYYSEGNHDKQLKIRKDWRDKHKDRKRELGIAWRKKNPSMSAEYRAYYRQLRKDAIPEHLIDCETEKKRVRDIYKLCTLISKATGITHHVDHMWPVSKGGPHWSGNLQIIPAHDNLCKSATLIPEIKQSIQDMLDRLT